MKLRHCALLFALVTGSAQAAFYVVDDSAQEPRQTHAASASSTYDVPFYLQRAQLGPLGRKTLEGLLLEAHRADQVVVTGYGDLNGSFLGQQRANAIFQWLVQHGVPTYKIVVTQGTGVRPSETVNVFNSTVSFAQRDARRNDKITATLVKNVREDAPPPASPPQELFNDQVKLALAARIVTLSHNGVLKPEDTVVLLTELLNGNPVATSPVEAQRSVPPAATAAGVQPVPTPAVQLAPIAESPPTWTLSSHKTLRENIADWAALAGWEHPVWEPSNPYQVTFSSTMTGTFLDVLGQIATAVPELDFEVSKSKRTLRVTTGRQ